MDVKYINPFINASKILFKDMFGIELTLGKPELITTETEMHEISATIGLAGDITGSVIISFPKDSALKAASLFMRSEILELSADVYDVIGEMVNIIAGNVNRDLDKSKVIISLPQVIIGDKYKVKYPENCPTVAIPLNFKEFAFFLVVSFREIPNFK